MLKYIYGLKKDGKVLMKGDCQQISEYLGITPTTLASYRWANKQCKGYEITLEEALHLAPQHDPRVINKKKKEEEEKSHLLPRIIKMCEKPPFYCTIIREKELTDDLKEKLGENYTYKYLPKDGAGTSAVWKIMWNGK